MHLIDFVLLALVAVIVFFAARTALRGGNCSCGCGGKSKSGKCSDCSSCSQCGRRP